MKAKANFGGPKVAIQLEDKPLFQQYYARAVLEMDELSGSKPWLNGWMTPPGNADQLAKWHYEYGALFDMGTLYTLIAGLLNVLAIFDAQAGPLILSREEDYEKKKSIQTRMKFNKG